MKNFEEIKSFLLKKTDGEMHSIENVIHRIAMEARKVPIGDHPESKFIKSDKYNIGIYDGKIIYAKKVLELLSIDPFDYIVSVPENKS